MNRVRNLAALVLLAGLLGLTVGCGGGSSSAIKDDKMKGGMKDDGMKGDGMKDDKMKGGMKDDGMKGDGMKGDGMKADDKMKNDKK